MARPWKETPELAQVVRDAEKAKAEGNEEQLKELKKKLKKQATICGAVMGNSKVCHRKPYVKEDNTTNGRCAVHAGKATGAKTPEGRAKALSKLNPKATLVHGAYSKDFKSNLTHEEVEFYNQTMDWFFDNYETDTNPVNLTLLDRFIINFLKQVRKDSVDFLSETQSYNDFEVKMIRFAETLGLNRKFTESKENKNNNNGVDLSLLFGDSNEQE